MPFIDQRNQQKIKHRQWPHRQIKMHQSNRIPQHRHRHTFKTAQAVRRVQIHRYHHDLHTIQLSNILDQMVQIHRTVQLNRLIVISAMEQPFQLH